MWKRVEDHALYWSAGERTGTAYLELEDGGRGQISHLSREDLASLSHFLQLEANVWYHTVRGDIWAGKQPYDDEDR